MIDSNLTHHLRTDAARRTGNEDHLVLQHGTDGRHVHRDRVARQQVLDVHLLQSVSGTLTAVLHEALGRLLHKDMYAMPDEQILQLCVVAEERRARP